MTPLILLFCWWSEVGRKRPTVRLHDDHVQPLAIWFGWGDECGGADADVTLYEQARRRGDKETG